MTWPWLDRSGHFSTFKAVAFALLFVPGLWIATMIPGDPRPWTLVNHETGLWIIRLLLISLAVTPLRQAWRWARLVTLRRMIGVATACYAGVHLVVYAGDLAFDLGKVASEILLRLYLTIGFVALLILLVLAITSTDGWVRRLGKRWQTLHRLVYLAMALGIAHFFLQSKLDIREPALMAGIFFWLMGYRAVLWARGSDSAKAPLTLLLLTLGAALLTVLGETAYVWINNGVDPLRVLGGNLRFKTGLRPGWWVLIGGLAITAVALFRQKQKAAERRRPAPLPVTPAPGSSPEAGMTQEN